MNHVSNFHQRLKEYRQLKGFTLNDLEKICGIPAQTLNRYELNQRTPKIDVTIEIAERLGINPLWLQGFDVHMDRDKTPAQSKGIRIPVLGSVVAGVPVEAVQDILDYEEITEEMASTGDFFALQIKGDSMEPRIKAGDVVIVRQQSDVESGQIAIVLVNGDEATCKKYVKHENGISLVSFNPAYSPMFYTADEAEQKPVRIIGRVIELRGKF